MPTFQRVAGWLLVAVGLVACSIPGSVRPGYSEAETRSAAGRPSATYPLPDGGQRWQYSGQPWSQWVWNIDFDAQGKVVHAEQVMSDEAFARVRPGWNRADIIREFGQPADQFSYALRNETAWMYRYFVAGGFHAAMFIYFDPAGKVLRTETGMDPWMIRDGNRD